MNGGINLALIGGAIACAVLILTITLVCVALLVVIQKRRKKNKDNEIHYSGIQLHHAHPALAMHQICFTA